MQRGKNCYWSESDVTWCEYVLCWTLEVVELWCCLTFTFELECYFRVVRIRTLHIPYWKLLVNFAAILHDNANQLVMWVAVRAKPYLSNRGGGEHNFILELLPSVDDYARRNLRCSAVMVWRLQFSSRTYERMQRSQGYFLRLCIAKTYYWCWHWSTSPDIRPSISNVATDKRIDGRISNKDSLRVDRAFFGGARCNLQS